MNTNPLANPYAQLRCLAPNDSLTSLTENAADLIIEFPVMPEVITLARRSNYNVTSVLPLPDGLHIYKNTEPLHIPISFKLHAFSDYNGNQGASMLLQMTAWLHSMTLPIRSSAGGGLLPQTLAEQNQTGGFLANYNSAYQSQANNNGSGNYIPSSTGSSSSGNNGAFNVAGFDNSLGFDSSALGASVPAFPPVCALRIIAFGGVANAKWGINCMGYVQDVDVKLRGPWLTADDQSYNLPTAAEFSFTFVNAPSYRNRLVGTPNASIIAAQAFAADVRDRLFNVADMSLANAGISTSDIVGLGQSTPLQAPKVPTSANNLVKTVVNGATATGAKGGGP